MNVLFITNELRYTCGVTNHLLHLARGLTEAGIKLWIISGGGNGADRFNDIKAEIITDKRFLHKGRSVTGFISAVNFLVKFIRKHRIDIIHSHNHYAANIAARAAAISQIKTVQTNHGIIQSKGRLKHFNASKYIAVNEHIYDYITGHNISPPEHVSLIRCGIPVEDAPPQKAEGKIKVIAASRFKYGKGLDVFINAASKISAAAKVKAELMIAGEGEMENSLKELSKNINAGIEFLGSVTDMYGLLRKTHILVYPSRSSSEGFPAVITEAGACNNLVISSRFKGSEYVLHDDVVLFDVDDSAGLAKKLEECIINYADYKAHTLKFYERIKDWYNLQTMTEKHLGLYNRLTGK